MPVLGFGASYTIAGQRVEAMAEEESSKFLPTHVRPIHYDLLLTPDLEKRKVYGEVSIQIEVKKPTKTIKMHQRDLELDHQSTIKLGEKSWQVTGTSDDNKEETVTFRFPEDVPKCDLAILTIKWSVDLKKETAGLYRTTYRDAKGKRHTTISSHFEPTNARRCFPCFDEPKSKATFSIRVVLDARFHVLSNMPPDTEDNIMPNVYPPMREWRFQKTPLMSTYLLGITAGEWDRVERKSKNGAVVRVWAPLGKASEAELASEWGTRALDFLDDYFATPYTLPKLDVVPIEDFSGIAMENWGVITFRARSLLVNSSTDSETILTMKEVLAHEIAHMWFGNLVSIRWWDSLWLKEGFATYFARFVCDALEPNAGWKSRAQLHQIEGKNFDAKSSTHPLESTVSNSGEANEVFDDVSYIKGASLVQMAESYIGGDAMRNGVRRYIDQFKFKNAASLDLWMALMKAATETKGPALKDVMKDWVKQEGYPIVTVEKDGHKIKLSQKRFLAAGAAAPAAAQKWTTPLRLSNNSLIVLEGETPLSIDVDAKLPFLVVNAGQRGFVLVNYAGELRTELLKNFSSLNDTDKAGIVGDILQLFRSKHLGIKELLDILSSLAATETSPTVWRILAEFWTYLLTVFDDDAASKSNLQKFGKGLFHKIFTSLGGIKHDPKQDAATIAARVALIHALALSDDKDVLLAAQGEVDAHGLLGVHADFRGVIWSAVVSKGHKPSLDALNALILNRSSADADVERASLAVQKTRNGGDVAKHFQATLPVVVEDNPLLDRRKAIDGGEIDKVKYKSSVIKPEFVPKLAEGLKDSNTAARQAGWTFISGNFEALVKNGGGAGIAEALITPFAWSGDEGLGRSIKDFGGRLNAELKQYVGKVVEHVAEDIRTNAAIKTASKNAIAQLK